MDQDSLEALSAEVKQRGRKRLAGERSSIELKSATC